MRSGRSGHEEGPVANKKGPPSFDSGPREIIPAVTYSPTQLPTQYHRR